MVNRMHRFSTEIVLRAACAVNPFPIRFQITAAKETDRTKVPGDDRHLLLPHRNATIAGPLKTRQRLLAAALA